MVDLYGGGMVTDAPSLSAFLRTLRIRAAPDNLGLPMTGRKRRVPGLRREEVARLAGVSVSYYTSLEQGRASHASPSVLSAIARALRLDDAEESHLLDLASAPAERPPGRGQRTWPEAALVQLFEAMPDVPAIAHDAALDLLAWNDLGRVLYAPHHDDEDGRPNLARMVFLEPASRDLYVDWPAKAAALAGAIRLGAGREPANAALADLVAELRAKSPHFERLWSSHLVRLPVAAATELRHPWVGRLTVNQRALTGLGHTNVYLLLTTTEPGSDSAERLRELSRLAQSRPDRWSAAEA